MTDLDEWELVPTPSETESNQSVSSEAMVEALRDDSARKMQAAARSHLRRQRSRCNVSARGYSRASVHLLLVALSLLAVLIVRVVLAMLPPPSPPPVMMPVLALPQPPPPPSPPSVMMLVLPPPQTLPPVSMLMPPSHEPRAALQLLQISAAPPLALICSSVDLHWLLCCTALLLWICHYVLGLPRVLSTVDVPSAVNVPSTVDAALYAPSAGTHSARGCGTLPWSDFQRALPKVWPVLSLRVGKKGGPPRDVLALLEQAVRPSTNLPAAHTSILYGVHQAANGLPLGWNDFQSAIRGKGLKRPEIRALYYVQKEVSGCVAWA